jgi:mRNA-degrading endonuclease RelE of RelBE toxin-antitoxin system
MPNYWLLVQNHLSETGVFMAHLMLHRELIKQFKRLPAKVLNKTYELIRKFEEDSKQASLHLEPLVPMVRDKKVRSARLGDDYRAIVIAPEKGDTFLLMHIDHHDKAYKWCANRQFEAHGALGSLQVFDISEVERIVDEVITPNTDSSELSHYPLDDLSDDDLFQAGVPRVLIPAVRTVRDDAHFASLGEYLPKEAEQVLFGVVSGLSLDDALAEMLDAQTPAVPPEHGGDFSHLAEVASQDLVLVDGEEHLREIMSEDIEEWRIFLHPYQKKLVQWDVKGPMKIYGAAGTGKTVALMHRAIWLAGRLQADERILVTTYTSNLAVTIQSLLEQMSAELSRRIDVINLHQLARTLCQRAGWRGKLAEKEDCDAIWDQLFDRHDPSAFGFSGEELIREYQLIIDPMGIDSEDAYLTLVRSGRPRMGRKQRKQLWRLFADFQRELAKRNLLTFDGVLHQARLALAQGLGSGYRHVLVDELQDFGLEALRLIRAISPIDRGLSNPLCLVGDGHQRIYTITPIALSRADIQVTGRSRRLKLNYRTSEQIRRLAHGILNAVVVDDLDGETVSTTGDHSVFRGPDPKVVECSSGKEAAEAARTWVEGLLKAGLGSHEICITPPNEEILASLESAGIPTLQLKPRQRDPGQEEQGIRYGTRQRIKGLEFKAVALLTDPNTAQASGRFADYVAATRAREYLLLLRLGA